MSGEFKKDQRYELKAYPGHVFRITSMRFDPFGNRVNATCSPQCCTYPAHIEISVPSDIFFHPTKKEVVREWNIKDKQNERNKS